MDFRTKLISELTQSDERQSKRKGYNRYALGMYFQAADTVIAEIAKGTRPERAFSDCFNPTSEMHKIAKNLGLNLDVERGQWIDPENVKQQPQQPRCPSFGQPGYRG